METIKRLLACDFNYLLVVVEYEEGTIQGPPFSISPTRINQLFGGFCNIQMVESHSRDIQCVESFLSSKDIDFDVGYLQQNQVKEVVYHLTRK